MRRARKKKSPISGQCLPRRRKITRYFANVTSQFYPGAPESRPAYYRTQLYSKRSRSQTNHGPRRSFAKPSHPAPSRGLNEGGTAEPVVASLGAFAILFLFLVSFLRLSCRGRTGGANHGMHFGLVMFCLAQSEHKLVGLNGPWTDLQVLISAQNGKIEREKNIYYLLINRPNFHLRDRGYFGK